MRTKRTPYRLTTALAAWMFALAGVETPFAACGQPITTGDKPAASDCLFVLRAAVGSASCLQCICDTNGSGTTTSSDALLCLRVAVGQPLVLFCPDCGTTTTTTTTTTMPPTTTTTLPMEAPCAGSIYQCGDGIDNDGDGLVDSDDPECLGACDNSEAGYGMDVPGSIAQCTQDCFWDDNTGAGDDDCLWSHKCDPLEVTPDFDPSGSECAFNASTTVGGQSCSAMATAQSETCHDMCGALVPNGCDCFGCCELPAGSGKFAWLGSVDEQDLSTCDPDSETDPGRCRPCTPVESCFNSCDSCEICVGMTTIDQEECKPGQICPFPATRCGLPGQDACAAGEYCVTGCCQPTLQ